MSRFLQAVKELVARQAIAYLKANAPEWLARLTVHEGQRVRHRFWQPGGGYDRNITDSETLRAMIEYIHANPVRRGLVARMEDWEWSSARWSPRPSEDLTACHPTEGEVTGSSHALRSTSGRATLRR